MAWLLVPHGSMWDAAMVRGDEKRRQMDEALLRQANELFQTRTCLFFFKQYIVGVLC